MTFKDRLMTKPGLAISGAGLLLLGGGIGAVAAHDGHRVEAMAPAAPVAINSLEQASRSFIGDAESVVTIHGRIAQVFGGQLVLNDGSGQVLVDTGQRRRLDEAATTLAVGQTVSVQGRYQDGVLRARYLVGGDGRVVALRSGGGRHRGGSHDGRRGGRDDDFGPPASEQPLTTPAPATAPDQNASAPTDAGVSTQ